MWRGTLASAKKDPHLQLAHGGKADFRGRNNTFYSMLSAPGVNFAARTTDTEFILPQPQEVHGSFFTQVSWTVRGFSDKVYGIFSDANNASCGVIDAKTYTPQSADKLGHFSCCHRSWKADGIEITIKQSTVFLRAHGWEMNATRNPIYNLKSGPSKWRFDIAMRKLDGTAFEATSGISSRTCFPHGIIGQSFDGDKIAVSGKQDTHYYNRSYPVYTTSAMAEGAIEGSAEDYELADPYDPLFKYSRFAKSIDSNCPPRDVSKLTGEKKRAAISGVEAELALSAEEIVELAGVTAA